MMLVMCYCRRSTFKVWGGEARTLCGALGAVEWMKNKEGLQGTAEDATGNRVIPGLPSHYSLCDFGHIAPVLYFLFCEMDEGFRGAPGPLFTLRDS